jgi:hypothetical protein
MDRLTSFPQAGHLTLSSPSAVGMVIGDTFGFTFRRYLIEGGMGGMLLRAVRKGSVR